MSAQEYFGIRNDLADRLMAGSHQLAGVPEPDRGPVLRAAVEAVPLAADWLRPFPALFAEGDSSASRLAFSCLSAAATFPRAELDQIASLGALTTILFGVDDIADGIAGSWSDRDFAAFFQRLPAILTGGAPPEGAGGPVTELLEAWRQWCERFHRYPGAAEHAAEFAVQLEIAGAAMGRERGWTSGVEAWPSYSGYLANGMITILYHTWWTAALGVCGPLPARAAHWTAIEHATDLGGSCLRLANDIRSFERERAEGKPNSISILERSGLSTAQAVAQVSAHVDELDAAFLKELGELPAELAGVAEGQRRSVAFNGGWYRARDTHAYTVQDLGDDARAHGG